MQKLHKSIYRKNFKSSLKIATRLTMFLCFNSLSRQISRNAELGTPWNIPCDLEKDTRVTFTNSK